MYARTVSYEVKRYKIAEDIYLNISYEYEICTQIERFIKLIYRLDITHDIQYALDQLLNVYTEFCSKERAWFS